ncbi:hypothetical protein P5705_10350 [Pseudomonas entomophila]|uniref:hypothetical protein n=1 Tax=Pseudomonas entomophila TaxID=312306 RepID=UPI002404EE23|nr:hypothetical protein [Pseudomonas entomophila]MDF9618044.1 hypothetical protein [Pseudomonas entomophila]
MTAPHMLARALSAYLRVSLIAIAGLLPALAWAISGPELAVSLNQAQQSDAGRCLNNHPAYFCSGVMLRQQPAVAAAKFWEHGTEAIALGAERFDWLRHDVQGSGITARNGYIFARRFEAQTQGKDYQLRGDDGSHRPSELQVVNWDSSRPQLIPVLALYYTTRDINGLPAAQKDQRDYFMATGTWLPVLRFDSASPPGRMFSFDLAEQLDTGERVAARLNQRYADTQAQCADGSPSYNCNGVLIRATSASTGFHSWNPTEASNRRDGVSWTYLRADTGILRLASNAPGLIFNRLEIPFTHKVRMRCAYPANAGTNSVPNSCRASCLSQNITTVPAWQRSYGRNPASSCAFSMEPTPSAAQYQLNIDVRASAGAHNEIIIGAWPPNIPEKLPIEAIYYPTGSRPSLAGAQYIQWDYFRETKKRVPIVQVNLAPGARVFSYLPDDQYLQERAPMQQKSESCPPLGEEAMPPGCVMN